MAYSQIEHYFCVEEGEQVDMRLVLPEDRRCAVIGTLVDKKNVPIDNAAVALFRVEGRCADDGSNNRHGHKEKLEPLTFEITDEHGNFVFGPLCPDLEYVVKIWAENADVRCENVRPRAKTYCISRENCGNEDGLIETFDDETEDDGDVVTRPGNKYRTTNIHK